tara:strand:+ start:74 stop:325 length:252 start_codon:yes stop_codon:yes gene_type:complete
MKITVDTTYYQNTYGRKPRGYGEWFFFSKNTGPGRTHTYSSSFPDNMQDLVWGTGTYTNIKNLAIAKAKEQGISEITVGNNSY